MNVITGVIIQLPNTYSVLMTSSSIDSRVILDQSGAEGLGWEGGHAFLDPEVRITEITRVHFLTNYL